MKMERIELLAPAGNLECLKVAKEKIINVLTIKAKKELITYPSPRNFL